MSSFVFLRHGQTEANRLGVMSGGNLDIPLNQEGLRQAQECRVELARYFAKEFSGQGVHVLQSPMLRAVQTVDQLLPDVKFSRRQSLEQLREWRVGFWEGHRWESVPNPFDWQTDPPGGESRDRFALRVEDALSKIWALPEPRLVVAHGMVGFVLLRALGVQAERLPNATPVIFERPSKSSQWVVKKMLNYS